MSLSGASTEPNDKDAYSARTSLKYDIETLLARRNTLRENLEQMVESLGPARQVYQNIRQLEQDLAQVDYELQKNYVQLRLVEMRIGR